MDWVKIVIRIPARLNSKGPRFMAEIENAVRLSSFRVQGLFGEFNHFVPLSANSRITALIGPNGMGKTACLRLINALFRRQWSVFSSTEFHAIEFIFSDASQVHVRHGASDDASDEGAPSTGIVIETYRNGVLVDTWCPKISDSVTARVARIEQFLPFLTRTGPRTWVHDFTRQTFSIQEVIESFGHQLPPSVLEALNAKPSEVLNELVTQIDCHLIETQRLLVFQTDNDRRFQNPPSTLAISQKAEKLKAIISRELAMYAATSQSLDRSFPKRVIQQGPIQPTEDLKSGLIQLDRLRIGLTEAGILDPEADNALLPIEEPDPAIAAVLSVYVKDTRQKLEVLATLRERILLFIELIDSRFKPKAVVVDKNVGFSVRRGSDVEVPLEKLSSGEQHQLVLFFELLFELKSNSLILIDEPELSLHVAWQKQFIPDLQRIIELNAFDVILATHSPQLIGKWGDLVVELGDVEAQ